MLADYGIAKKEYKEAKNDKEVAMKLSDALGEIANGKIAVVGKMVEEAKQAKNETAKQKWQFEQDKAFRPSSDPAIVTGKQIGRAHV